MRWQTYFNYFYVMESRFMVDFHLAFHYYFANNFFAIKRNKFTNHHWKVSLFDFDEFEAHQYHINVKNVFLFPDQLLSTTRRSIFISFHWNVKFFISLLQFPSNDYNRKLPFFFFSLSFSSFSRIILKNKNEICEMKKFL